MQDESADGLANAGPHGGIHVTPASEHGWISSQLCGSMPSSSTGSRGVFFFVYKHSRRRAPAQRRTIKPHRGNSTSWTPVSGATLESLDQHQHWCLWAHGPGEGRLAASKGASVRYNIQYNISVAVRKRGRALRQRQRLLKPCTFLFLCGGLARGNNRSALKASCTNNE